MPRRRSHADGRHPRGLRIDRERGGGERDAVGHAAVLVVQPLRPIAAAPACAGSGISGTGSAGASVRRRTATRRSDRAADDRSRATARSPPRAWRRRRRSSRGEEDERHDENDAGGAEMQQDIRASSCRWRAPAAKKPPARISDTRFEMVMVRRSLEAANAISAGNSISRIASATMVIPPGRLRWRDRRSDPLQRPLARGFLPIG